MEADKQAGKMNKMMSWMSVFGLEWFCSLVLSTVKHMHKGSLDTNNMKHS